MISRRRDIVKGELDGDEHPEVVVAEAAAGAGGMEAEGFVEGEEAGCIGEGDEGGLGESEGLCDFKGPGDKELSDAFAAVGRVDGQ